MSNDGNTPMHVEFPRWYREVGVDENRERMQRRWNGVAALAASATRADVECVLRVVFRAKSVPSAESLAHVRQQFKGADDLFEMSGNDREFEILCGAALAVLIERTNDTGATTALAITTANLNGARVADLPMNLPALAQVATARIAEDHRTRPTLDHGLKAVPKVNFAKAKAKLEEEPDAAGMSAALDLAAESVNVALENVGKALAASQRFIAIQDEELELLWWVFGERSDDLNQLFKDVPVKIQPLVFAKELAGATEFLPGPASIKSLLSRAGLKDSKKLTIPDVVNACDAGWLGSIAAKSDISPLVQPIHFAIRRKLETGDEASWVAGWAGACGVDEKHSFSALTLGCLFYCERLLSIFAED